MDLRASYADDYQYDSSVIDGVYSFGPSRVFSGTTPTLPATIKVGKADPSQKQTIQAAATGIAIESTDLMLTIWAKTLSASYAFKPHIDDVIAIGSDRYLIKSVSEACFGTQYVCYCKASPRNVT